MPGGLEPAVRAQVLKTRSKLERRSVGVVTDIVAKSKVHAGDEHPAIVKGDRLRTLDFGAKATDG